MNKTAKRKNAVCKLSVDVPATYIGWAISMFCRSIYKYTASTSKGYMKIRTNDSTA